MFFTVLNFNPSLIDKTFHILSPPTPALNLTPFSSGSGSGREGRGKRSQAIPPKAAYKGLNWDLVGWGREKGDYKGIGGQIAITSKRGGAQ